jgi:hypothetical protein
MEVYIVYLRSATDDFEDAAVVVAETREQAIKMAMEDFSSPVSVDDIECVRVCDDSPCIHWLV